MPGGDAACRPPLAFLGTGACGPSRRALTDRTGPTPAPHPEPIVHVAGWGSPDRQLDEACEYYRPRRLHAQIIRKMRCHLYSPPHEILDSTLLLPLVAHHVLPRPTQQGRAPRQRRWVASIPRLHASADPPSSWDFLLTPSQLSTIRSRRSRTRAPSSTVTLVTAPIRRSPTCSRMPRRSSTCRECHQPFNCSTAHRSQSVGGD